jgi:hypothetical protein
VTGVVRSMVAREKEKEEDGLEEINAKKKATRRCWG